MFPFEEPDPNVEDNVDAVYKEMQMKDTYKAVEVSAPGVLRVVERQVSQPGAGQVRIRVEACGICHTDFPSGHSAAQGSNAPTTSCPGTRGRVRSG
jgi:D-arabinose 1-dehydrogenase-like Zn-dependent alcohol dehydrogenase